MSYANGTPFLNLAQTIGTDHRDWFDENAAKLDLDTKMKTLWDGAADTAEILATLQESVGSLQTDVTTLEGVVSGHTSTITTINESLVLINTALNALNTQVTNKFDSAGIADPYDATYGIYAVGDVVTYNGQRYVCSTAVTAAEPFDVSKWTAKDIQTELDEIDALMTDTWHYVVGTSTSDSSWLRYKNLSNVCYVEGNIGPITLTVNFSQFINDNTLPTPDGKALCTGLSGVGLIPLLIEITTLGGVKIAAASDSADNYATFCISYPIGS